MADGVAALAAASAAFVGSHFVLSHPLRAPLVKAVGANLFLLLYSVVAIATFAWMVLAFARTPGEGALWDGFGLVPWVVTSVLTLLGAALLVGSFFGNPVVPGAKLDGLSAKRPRGAFVVTRHPMMWGLALIALGHVVVAPTTRSLVFMGALLLLALGGAAGQDHRKMVADPKEWGVWRQRTSFVPRLERIGAMKLELALATFLWLAITGLHLTFGGIPAGIWRVLS